MNHELPSVNHPPYTVGQGWALKRLVKLLIQPLLNLSRWQVVTAGSISTTVVSQNFQLGEFTIAWQGMDTELPNLQISHRDFPGRVVWQTCPGQNFVGGANVNLNIVEERGSIEIDENKKAQFSHQTVDRIYQAGDTLTIAGSLLPSLTPLKKGGRGDRRGAEGEGNPQYFLALRSVGAKELDFQLQIDDERINQAQLQFATSPEEHFYGFGEQFSHIDCKGYEVPIVVEEGGIGRGDPGPRILNLLGVAGERFSSYAPTPYFLTNRGRSLFLFNLEPSIFDLRHPQIASIRLASSFIHGRILVGDTPLDLIELYTNYAGRIPPLPDWIDRGAIVGMQGGTDKVRQVWSQLRDLDTPIAGFWLQDWVGQRRTIAGKQLWWNWQLDRSTYPGWKELVADLAQEGITVGVYINPFLIDNLPDRGEKQRHLFLEAEKQGFLVKNKDETPYFITNTNFSHGLVDLSNLDARQWFKSIIKDEVLGSGAKFWMADFGEAAPFDGTFASNESGLSYHNQYPVDWMKINREAIDEAGLAGEAWFFNRAGFLKTPQHSTGMWLGDQNTTWNDNDGMPSALKGLVSAGFSGFSLNHSDIGGYTSIAFFHPIVEFLGMGFRRSPELLFRWMEMNAFTPIFRTHEGNQPDKNAQFYTDDRTLTTFSYWAKIYATLANYRQQLQKEATTKGYPLVRHLILHYPKDPNVCRLETQFMLGSEFLIAPVMQPRKHSIQVYFPAGEWVHFWSSKIYGLPHQGMYQQVPAPLGQPAVFYRRGSEAGEKAIAALKAKGLLEFGGKKLKP